MAKYKLTLTLSNGTTVDAGTFEVKDGYTPVKGIDYFTEAEKQEIAEQASQLSGLRFKLDDGTILY